MDDGLQVIVLVDEVVICFFCESSKAYGEYSPPHSDDRSEGEHDCIAYEEMEQSIDCNPLDKLSEFTEHRFIHLVLLYQVREYLVHPPRRGAERSIRTHHSVNVFL